MTLKKPYPPIYKEISDADIKTDITAEEMETLTNGSNADHLHVHSGTGGGGGPCDKVTRYFLGG